MQTTQSGTSETTQGMWSVWGVRLAAVVSAALVVTLGWAWIETFYHGVAVSSQLSFTPADKPYMPLHTIAKPIIGNHYFGDFQFPLGYATDLLRHSMSPYLGSSIPDNYPPFSQVFFVLFSLPPLRVSALIYLLLSAAVFLTPLWLMLAPLKREYRIIFLTPVAVLTTPFISFLDRGNDIGIVVGLIAWTIWAWRSERWVLCGTFLAAAIALKGYPAALLVVPLGLRRYKFTAIVAASVAGVNLLVLAAFPGGFVRNLRALIPALQGKANPLTQLSSWSLYSVIPKTAGLLFGRASVNPLLAPRGLIVWLPAIVYVSGVYFVIRRGRIPQWCWGPLALATLQLVDPTSFVYTTAWAPVAAVWFALGYLVRIRTETLSEDGENESVTLRIMLVFAFTVTLTPSVFTISGTASFSTPLVQYLSPVFLFLTLCAAIIYSSRSITSNPISES